MNLNFHKKNLIKINSKIFILLKGNVFLDFVILDLRKIMEILNRVRTIYFEGKDVL